MRLLISGGGTGGHLFPALAVARAFRAESRSGAVLLVGRAGGPEEKLVVDAGFDLETIVIRGFDRDARWKNLGLPVVLPAALARGYSIVRRFRPDVVLGVGGYAMVPSVAAARVGRVPYVLHEQNFLPGLATRSLAGGAAAVCITFPGTSVRARRVELTGLPLRPGFSRRTPAIPPRKLLVTGGSQGARRLNEVVWEALEDLLARFTEVIHVTGRQGAEEGRRRARPRYRPLDFTADMAGLLAEADLVVSRAGVGTLAEITAVGLPAILVPGTFGGGHQEANAAVLVEAGAAVRIGDDDFDPQRLLAAISSLDDERLRRLADASASLGRHDAAERVLAVLKEVAAR
ncbi:MAG: UDP-N-acetylglucosamine--N-acetylmuramyl-(pentapeptide) pyrophosphoryl-undecaprenol N-acetylglucosamine transferase [Chloroflexi bacterium]|nr:MAG: UDP-N-acetylglucosamine--N-acetylmuramyl-(pentapeptide) pyrophosphoryl-undecaprenol N-acetylglucosamine transferase [Chloroflexota bacterium]